MAASERKRVAISFDHGLGDCSAFAHWLPVYRQHGVDVAVHCSPDKAPLFLAAGAMIIPAGGHVDGHHGWPHAHPGRPQHHDQWSACKSLHMIGRDPLPLAGDPAELASQVVDARLTLAGQVTAEDRAAVARLVDGMPTPLVLLHTHGNTSADSKNLPADFTHALYTALLDRMPGTIILLDWDSRVPRMRHWRVRHLMDDWRALTLPELWAIYERADLLIGIDSGPLHFARFSAIPAIGVWLHHHPAHFCLPRANTIHVAPRGRFSEWTKYTRATWQVMEPPGERQDPHHLADLAADMLGGAKLLPADYGATLAQDVLMRHWLRGCRGTRGALGEYVDRHRTFEVMLGIMLSGARNPRIVETGCIRAEEDWAGAGFGTYILAAVAKWAGGSLDSVDITDSHVEFARKWVTPFASNASIHAADSLEFLASRREPIDLLYLDSMDTDFPGHAEHCLREAELGATLLSPAGVLAIDDTAWRGGAEWAGKGRLAVPWLLEHGWRIVTAGYQVVMARRENSTGRAASERAG